MSFSRLPESDRPESQPRRRLYSERAVQGAIDLYENCRGGFMDDDPGLKMKLLQALFLNKEYSRCIEIGRSLEGNKEFKTAVERISFAWALYYTGLTTEAETNFAAMDHSFSNYVHRYQFCVFLKTSGRTEEAKQKATELKDEILHMKGNERRIHRDIISQIRTLA